jgi:lipopolysaccharide export system permease protein
MVFKNFTYSTWDENYNVKEVVAAEFADWVPPAWELKNGQLTVHDKTGSFVSKPFGVYNFDFPESPDDFLVPEYESAEMSLTRLFTDISRRDSESEKTRAQAEFYGRISYLLIGIPLLLLGLPILLLSYQKWGRDLSIAIPVSCFMAFVAWGLWGALQSFAKTGYIMTLPAAFVVHILFSLIGIYLLSKQDE